MKTAICSGSFDPITLGHLDIISRAADLFDQVVVCVSPNAEKKCQMFSPEQKLRLVQEAVNPMPNVAAELWSGLLAEFACKHNAVAIVRGVRNGTDFDVECSLARINAGLCDNQLDTVMLPAAAQYQHMSSTMAREMIRYNRPLEPYLPEAILPLIQEMRKG